MSPSELIAPPALSVVPAVTMLALGALLVIRSRSRRHEALNRSLHEIRRPLQVLALSLPEVRPAAATGADVTRFPSRPAAITHRQFSEPVRQAISALSVLDSQINGGVATASKSRRSELIAVRLMADACVRRWLPFARLAGAEIRMVWVGADVLVRGDGTALAAAVENLIANAIEHGGPKIEVSGAAIGRKVRLVVRDSGIATRDRRRPVPVPADIEDLAAVAGHGHGLEVVRATVSEHGGKFEFDRGTVKSEAVIVLPVSPARRPGAGGVKVNW